MRAWIVRTKRPLALALWCASCCFLVTVTLPARLSAQSYPEAEGYVGFSLYNNEYGTTRHNSPGMQFGAGYNVARYLQLMGDFGAQFHSTPIRWTNGKKVEADSFQFLFGPELRMRNRSAWTPFAHGLAGVAYRRYAVPTGTWTCTGLPPICYQDTFTAASETGFAWAVGGGLEWSNHPAISVRVFQFDFVRTKLSRDNLDFSPAQGQFPTLTGRQDNYRFSFGITFRFGAKGEPRAAHETVW
jgi:Outer membrane protein beta-barrel domain